MHGHSPAAASSCWLLPDSFLPQTAGPVRGPDGFFTLHHPTTQPPRHAYERVAHTPLLLPSATGCWACAREGSCTWRALPECTASLCRVSCIAVGWAAPLSRVKACMLRCWALTVASACTGGALLPGKGCCHSAPLPPSAHTQCCSDSLAAPAGKILYHSRLAHTFFVQVGCQGRLGRRPDASCAAHSAHSAVHRQREAVRVPAPAMAGCAACAAAGQRAHDRWPQCAVCSCAQSS